MLPATGTRLQSRAACWPSSPQPSTRRSAVRYSRQRCNRVRASLWAPDEEDEPAAPAAREKVRLAPGEVPQVAPWQRRRLEAAHLAGRRHVSVSISCVPAFQTTIPPLAAPSARIVAGSMPACKTAECSEVKQLVGDAKMDRREVLAWLKHRATQPDPPQKSRPAAPEAGEPSTSRRAVDAADSRAAVDTANMTFAERQDLGGDFARKRLKRSTEMTLEKVFDRYRWPPDHMISDICQLHREMTPLKIKLWFEEQRRAHPEAR